MSTYRRRINGLGRRHLALAVANCVLNRRFNTLRRWKLRRVAGSMTENALSILIVIFSVQLQQTEI